MTEQKVEHVNSSIEVCLKPRIHDEQYEISLDDKLNKNCNGATESSIHRHVLF